MKNEKVEVRGSCEFLVDKNVFWWDASFYIKTNYYISHCTALLYLASWVKLKYVAQIGRAVSNLFIAS